MLGELSLQCVHVLNADRNHVVPCPRITVSGHLQKPSSNHSLVSSTGNRYSQHQVFRGTKTIAFDIILRCRAVIYGYSVVKPRVRRKKKKGCVILFLIFCCEPNNQ